MSRRQVTAFLIVFWSVCWLAVVLRIDRFPVSWAPMYSVWEPSEKKTFRVTRFENKRLAREGWRAIQRNGEERTVSRQDLNIRRSSMRRLYYRRTLGKGPPGDRHRDSDRGTLDRWLWGLDAGEPFVDIDWRRRLFVSINKTLGLEPSDDEFIVRLQMERERMTFDKETLELLRRKRTRREIVWDEAWNGDF